MSRELERDHLDVLRALGAERVVELERELAGGEELLGDVRAADQLALDEHLRDRRPTGDPGQLLADARIREHVDRGDRRAGGVQGLQRAMRVSAHDQLWRAFHEHGDGLVLDHVGDLLVQGFHAVPFVLIRSSWMEPSARGAASASFTRRCWSRRATPSKSAVTTVTWKWSPVPVRSSTSTAVAPGKAPTRSARIASARMRPS